MEKVYIIKEQDRFDYSKAEEFGEIVFLTSSEFASHRNSIKNTEIKNKMKYHLEDYKAGIDYLVLTGSPLMMAVGFHYACEHGNIHRILKWNNQEMKYAEVIIEV